MRIALKFVALAIFLLALTNSAISQDDLDYRLPPDIQPTSQSIELEVDPAQIGYSGRTAIQLTIRNEANRIGIYQIGLELSDITLSNSNGSRTLQASAGSYDINWLADGSAIAAGDGWKLQ